MLNQSRQEIDECLVGPAAIAIQIGRWIADTGAILRLETATVIGRGGVLAMRRYPTRRRVGGEHDVRVAGLGFAQPLIKPSEIVNAGRRVDVCPLHARA